MNANNYFCSCSFDLRHFGSTPTTSLPAINKNHMSIRFRLKNANQMENKNKNCIFERTGKRVDKTTPQISEPTRNCSPSIAIHTFSHARSILFLRNRITHLPPLAFCGSSHIALMPLLNKCNSRYGFSVDGRIKRQ